ncbi:cation:proton antiporter [Thauera humireducens]|uniref:cation:proton antiporter domain-containing protein n=1 Tax=Thauera humireducens TaxID=1134435 RepID=UPI0031202903
MVGNRRSHATEHVLRVMDGLAWLSQAVMFVVLGLLVSPTNMLAHAWEAMAMAVFLTLVARPIAVAIGLWPFNYKRNELAYVSWVGLRGAVPVTLAIFPVMMGVPDSDLLFNVAFAVVLLSLLVQGATVPVAARWLKVDVPPRPEPVDMREVWVGGQGRARSAGVSRRGGFARGRSPPRRCRRRSGRHQRALRGPGASWQAAANGAQHAHAAGGFAVAGGAGRGVGGDRAPLHQQRRRTDGQCQLLRRVRGRSVGARR